MSRFAYKGTDNAATSYFNSGYSGDNLKYKLNNNAAPIQLVSGLQLADSQDDYVFRFQDIYPTAQKPVEPVVPSPCRFSKRAGKFEEVFINGANGLLNILDKDARNARRRKARTGVQVHEEELLREANNMFLEMQSYLENVLPDDDSSEFESGYDTSSMNEQNYAVATAVPPANASVSGDWSSDDGAADYFSSAEPATRVFGSQPVGNNLKRSGSMQSVSVQADDAKTHFPYRPSHCPDKDTIPETPSKLFSTADDAGIDSQTDENRFFRNSYVQRAELPRKEEINFYIQNRSQIRKSAQIRELLEQHIHDKSVAFQRLQFFKNQMEKAQADDELAVLAAAQSKGKASAVTLKAAQIRRAVQEARKQFENAQQEFDAFNYIPVKNNKVNARKRAPGVHKKKPQIYVHKINIRDITTPLFGLKDVQPPREFEKPQPESPSFLRKLFTQLGMPKYKASHPDYH